MKIIDNDLTIQEVCGRIGGYHRCSLEDGYPNVIKLRNDEPSRYYCLDGVFI